MQSPFFVIYYILVHVKKVGEGCNHAQHPLIAIHKSILWITGWHLQRGLLGYGAWFLFLEKVTTDLLFMRSLSCTLVGWEGGFFMLLLQAVGLEKWVGSRCLFQDLHFNIYTGNR